MAGKGYAPCLPDILIICQTFFFVDLPPDLLAAAGTFSMPQLVTARQRRGTSHRS